MPIETPTPETVGGIAGAGGVVAAMIAWFRSLSSRISKTEQRVAALETIPDQIDDLRGGVNDKIDDLREDVTQMTGRIDRLLERL